MVESLQQLRIRINIDLDRLKIVPQERLFCRFAKMAFATGIKYDIMSIRLDLRTIRSAAKKSQGGGFLKNYYRKPGSSTLRRLLRIKFGVIRTAVGVRLGTPMLKCESHRENWKFLDLRVRLNNGCRPWIVRLISTGFFADLKPRPASWRLPLVPTPEYTELFGQRHGKSQCRKISRFIEA